MIKDIAKLSELPGISGQESAVRAFIKDKLKTAPALESVETDRMGNLIVRLKGKQAAPKRVMFAAHMDEVGGVVSGFTEDGLLRFSCVGSINAEVLYACRVNINGHIGVIGGKAFHQCKSEERETAPDIGSMLIDVGADTREEAEAIADYGDAVILDQPVRLLEDGKFRAKALDDRAGCAMLLRMAQTVPEYDVTLVFTTQEEVGLRGAGPAAFTVEPDLAVIVDSTTAADSFEVPEDKQVCRLGGGPVVSFMDKRTVYDMPLYRYIRHVAEKNGLPSQTKTTVAGGNDAGTVQLSRGGVRVAAVSLPCRYIHSPSSVLDEADADTTAKLLICLMNTLPAWNDTL